MKKNEICAGGIVINKKRILIVYEKNSKIYSFPKGHKKNNESLIENAKREIFEETGIKNLSLIKKLGSYKRSTIKHPDNIKKITLFLFTTDVEKLDSREKQKSKPLWTPINEVAKILSYKEDKDFFKKIKKNISL